MIKKMLIILVTAGLAGLGGATGPSDASAAEASVCQFYKGDPLCKTKSETTCFGASAGVEASYCTTETDYWYWS